MMKPKTQVIFDKMLQHVFLQKILSSTFLSVDFDIIFGTFPFKDQSELKFASSVA